MNAPLSPEVLLRRAQGQDTGLPPKGEGVSRYVWEGRYGSMLIEVLHDDVFINGQRVEPHVP